MACIEIEMENDGSSLRVCVFVSFVFDLKVLSIVFID